MLNFRHRRWYKNLKLAFCWLVMLVIGGGCVMIGRDGGLHKYPSLFYSVIGWLNLLFAGVGGLFILYKERKFHREGRELIELTEQGLLINNDLIPWNTIIGFRKWQSSVVLVCTNDCEERMAEAGWYKRMIMRFDYKLTGAVCSFSEDYLDCSLAEFTEQCRPYIERTGRKLSRSVRGGTLDYSV